MIKTFSVFIFSVFAFHAHAADMTKNVNCFDDTGVITVTLDVANGQATDITWLQARSLPPAIFTLTSQKPASALWPSLPTADAKAWPMGSYVGQLNGETLILNIARKASAGGGGCDWEGILTYVRTDASVLTWGMYCAQ